MKYRGLAIVLAILHCLPMATAAQEEVTRLSFTVYGLRPGDYTNIYYQDAKSEPKQLEFHHKQRSKSYEAEVLTETPVLKFFRKASDDEKSSEGAYREISAIRIPKNSERLLLVFVPRNKSENDEPFRILPVDDDLSAGQNGTVRIINLTGLTLLGMVDSKRFELPSLSCSQPFRAASRGQSDFSIVAEGTSRYHLVYRNSFNIDSESRAILFLTPPYRKVSLKLGGQMLYEELAGGGD